MREDERGCFDKNTPRHSTQHTDSFWHQATLETIGQVLIELGTRLDSTRLLLLLLLFSLATLKHKCIFCLFFRHLFQPCQFIHFPPTLRLVVFTCALHFHLPLLVFLCLRSSRPAFVSIKQIPLSAKACTWGTEDWARLPTTLSTQTRSGNDNRYDSAAESGAVFNN